MRKIIDCIPYISEQYQVPVEIIESVVLTESAGRNVISTNKNGSKDYGVMQINDWWLPILNKHGIDSKDLMNVCTNISVGSWILRYEYSYFQDWSDALASYNAGRSGYKEPYAIKYAYKVLSKI